MTASERATLPIHLLLLLPSNRSENEAYVIEVSLINVSPISVSLLSDAGHGNMAEVKSYDLLCACDTNEVF